MSKILVSGSIAYDYIMNFHDKFGKYILPERTNSLSVNFNIHEMKRHDGGAGHNIAYNLSFLGEKALLMGAVGTDFVASRYNQQHIDYTYTHISQSLVTPSAHIISDEDGNQITTFYPGAGMEPQRSILDVEKSVESPIVVAIVSPNNPSVMVQHLRECNQLKIPVIFDPGQPLSAFSKEQLHEALSNTTYLIVNEYERDLLCKIAEIEENDLLSFVDAYIVTLGAEGSQYVSNEETFTVDVEKVDDLVDPTGAGDAYRAGILRAIKNGKSRKQGMELGSQLARACIQCHGTQHHTFAMSN